MVRGRADVQGACLQARPPYTLRMNLDWVGTTVGDAPLGWALVALLVPQVITLFVALWGNKTSTRIAESTNAHSLQMTRESLTLRSDTEHQAWLRGTRQEIYTDTMIWLSDLESRLKGVINEHTAPDAITRNERVLTGRLRTSCPAHIYVLWRDCVEHYYRGFRENNRSAQAPDDKAREDAVAAKDAALRDARVSELALFEAIQRDLGTDRPALRDHNAPTTPSVPPE